MRLITLLLILSLANCGTVKQDLQMKEIYFQEFKTTYFKRLLRKGFNKDKGYDNAVKIDNSHYAEPILSLEDINYIDSLTVVGNHFMTSDSLQSFGKRAEGAEGKRVFYFALDRYNSKWLDSITKKRFKKYWKFEMDFRKSLRK